eukprot:TRINITY_DN2124_c6_g1_i1.p1 TRINITY_DN2124_c6_g1~~TRINITY_DN2124_c6_g1_i1.p1  ORF type:complete len:660 (-),score=129.58 TRINITY_DN2124_c6_g1_i1:49-2028(-)
MGKDGGLASFLLATNDYGLLTQLCLDKFGDEEFATVLTQYLFREKKLSDYLSHLVKVELNKETRATLFRETSIVTWLFVSATGLPPSVAFLKKCVNKTTKRLQALKYALEVDPVRMNNLDLTSAAQVAALQRNPATIRKFLDSFMLDVVSAVKHSLPSYFRRFFEFVLEHVGSNFPEMDNAIAGNFLFLRWICPSLICHCNGNRSAILLCKMAQAVANGANFGEKEVYMVQFNEDVARHINETLPTILSLLRVKEPSKEKGKDKEKGKEKGNAEKEKEGLIATSSYDHLQITPDCNDPLPSSVSSSSISSLDSTSPFAGCPANPRDWNHAHFDRWLESELSAVPAIATSSSGAISFTFEESGLRRGSVSGAAIMTLDRNELQRLGVNKIGHRLRIMKLIRDELYPEMDVSISAGSSGSRPNSRPESPLITPSVSSDAAILSSVWSLQAANPSGIGEDNTSPLPSRQNNVNTRESGPLDLPMRLRKSQSKPVMKVTKSGRPHSLDLPMRRNVTSPSALLEREVTFVDLESDLLPPARQSSMPTIASPREAMDNNNSSSSSSSSGRSRSSSSSSNSSSSNGNGNVNDDLPMAGWSVGDVSAFLRSIPLSDELVESLANEGFDGRKLCHHGSSHVLMAELGIRKVGQRIHILRRVQSEAGTE